MLFNSYVFIGAFLPVALVVYFLLARLASPRPALVWLTIASLFFYGWWKPEHLPLLLASLGGNYLMGQRLARLRRSGSVALRTTLAIGVAANLCLLAYYKYATFLVGTAASLTGGEFAIEAVALPLAISFYTFQQIAYLVDASRGETESYDFVDYCLFVTFFPQLIAGPIVHHKEVMPQFARLGAPGSGRFDHAAFAEGMTFFSIGLFKKVALADTVAPLADAAFQAAADGQPITAAVAWSGVLAYTMQLYFDFSGYSDMAVGIARMFGIRIPYNFDSPYKATSIVDFWRRWHMTLSRFLRDYLYIPLGGSRRGPARRHANLAATMVLGGLWHGAGWTFVAWGALHGLYLGANHAWNELRARFGQAPRAGSPQGFAGRWAGRIATLLAVMVAWVFFRAPDMAGAVHMLGAMAGANGWIAPGDPLLSLVAPVPDGSGAVEALRRLDDAMVHVVTILLLGVAWLAPNAQEIVDGAGAGMRRIPIRWRPTLGWSAVVSGCFLYGVTQLSAVSAFLYFQF
jgi:D-alanyl-lipoteichoic acid acyltransferase DltB (MBOAT superfamily)